MEQLAYQRPREKLQTRGVAYLTDVELIQIIVGSGSMYVSGARLAKRIDRHLKAHDSSVKTLQSIQGVGSAKASQIISAIELGRRFHQTTPASGLVIDQTRVLQYIKTARRLTAAVFYFDGARRLVKEAAYDMYKEGLSNTIRVVVEVSINCQARSVVVAIGMRHDLLHITTEELDIIKRLKEALTIVSVSITSVYRANAQKVEVWSDL